MIEDIKFFTAMKCDCGYVTHSFFKILIHFLKCDKSKLNWKNIQYCFLHSIEILPIYLVIIFIIVFVLNVIKLICYPFWKIYNFIEKI